MQELNAGTVYTVMDVVDTTAALKLDRWISGNCSVTLCIIRIVVRRYLKTGQNYGDITSVDREWEFF